MLRSYAFEGGRQLIAIGTHHNPLPKFGMTNLVTALDRHGSCVESAQDLAFRKGIPKFLHASVGHLCAGDVQRGAVGEIAIMKKQPFLINIFVSAQMFDPRPQQIACPANNSMHGVTFAQKQLAKIGTVLTGNTGDEGLFH